MKKGVFVFVHGIFLGGTFCAVVDFDGGGVF